MHSRNVLHALTVAALWLPLYAAAADPATSTKPIAKVNGVSIPQSRFELVARGQLGQGQEDNPKFREDLREIGAATPPFGGRPIQFRDVWPLTHDGKAVFPNAVVRAASQDADFWLSADKLKQASAGSKSNFERAQAVIKPYQAAGHFKPFSGDGELSPGIAAFAAHGHTPGHSVYQVTSQGQKLLLLGDLIHVAAVQMEVKWLQPEANARAMAQWIGRVASEASVDLVVFPELANSGYVTLRNPEFMARYYGAAEAIPGPTTAILGEAARQHGLIDELAEGDLTAAGVAFAERVVAERRPLRKIRDLDDTVAAARGKPEVFAAFRKSVARQTRGFRAPEHCIKAVEAAVTLPFTQGLARERELFLELLNSPESKAQRYFFFAEREAAKIPDVPADTPTRDVRTAAVLGAGTMGGGIAMNFANVGIPVTVVEVSREALDRGLGVVRKNYEATAAKGRLVSAEEIRLRAYLKWEAAGRPAGDGSNFWLEAERELVRDELAHHDRARVGPLAHDRGFVLGHPVREQLRAARRPDAARQVDVLVPDGNAE